MTTPELENAVYRAVACKNGNTNWPKNCFYMCREIAIPFQPGTTMARNRERVDLLCLESHGEGHENGIWRMFELKVSKADFHSKAALSFYGHFNYFALPEDLYEKVKDKIPDGIGVYVARTGDMPAVCVKKPKRRELVMPHEKLLFALMQGLARENQKQLVCKED